MYVCVITFHILECGQKETTNLFYEQLNTWLCVWKAESGISLSNRCDCVVPIDIIVPRHTHDASLICSTMSELLQWLKSVPREQRMSALLLLEGSSNHQWMDMKKLKKTKEVLLESHRKWSKSTLLHVHKKIAYCVGYEWGINVLEQEWRFVQETWDQNAVHWDFIFLYYNASAIFVTFCVNFISS